MERRDFLKAAAASTAATLVLGRRAAFSQMAGSHIEILLDEPIGTIAPEIYGHFTEHLGTVIYGGIYVGEDSKIPNEHGLRSALIEKMHAIKAPVVRWPGGCFADSYDWRDGIGPRERRPRRTNFWTDAYPDSVRNKNIPQVFEPNTFGTSGLRAFLQAMRRGTLYRGQCAQSAGAGIRPLGGILQFTTRFDYTGGDARRRWFSRTV